MYGALVRSGGVVIDERIKASLAPCFEIIGKARFCQHWGISWSEYDKMDAFEIYALNKQAELEAKLRG